MVATIAALGVIFLFGLGFLFHRQAVLERDRRRDLEGMVRRQNHLEHRQGCLEKKVEQDNGNTAILAKAAVYTAQRAEERAIANRPVVIVVGPVEESRPVVIVESSAEDEAGSAEQPAGLLVGPEPP